MILGQHTFKRVSIIKDSTLHAPILSLPNPEHLFSVACDLSDFATGSALLQTYSIGHERVVAFEYRQLKAAEKNYPVHDKGLIALKYALIEFRVHILDFKPFVVYTDHASLRTATQSLHHALRTAHWIFFYSEYNFEVKCKSGNKKVLADALSLQSDYELAHLKTLSSPVENLIRVAYAQDPRCEDYSMLLEATRTKNRTVICRHG